MEERPALARSLDRSSVWARFTTAGACIALLLAACSPPSRDAHSENAPSENVPSENAPSEHSAEVVPVADPASLAGVAESGLVEEQLASLAEACTSRPDRDVCLRAADGYRRALAHYESVGDRPRQAEIQQQLGRLHRKYLEDRRAALRYYGAAKAIYAQLGDRQSESVVLNNLGRLHFQLGEMKLAVEHWELALPVKREIGDAAGEAATLSNLGLACRYRGDFQAALDYYDQALDVLQTAGERVQLGRAYNNRGRFYDSLGRSNQALADLQMAQKLGRKTRDPALQAMALTALGRIQLAAGDADSALASLELAAGFRQAAGSERGIAVTARSLGEVYEATGRLDEARRAQETAQRVFEQQASPRDLARTHESLGRLALASGKAVEAERHYRRAGELFRNLEDPEGVVSSLSGLAHALRTRGDIQSAEARVTEVLGRVEELRRRAATPDLRRSFLARYQNDIGFLVDLLMEQHRRAPGAGHDRRAFEVHERSKARALFDQIEAPLRGVIRAEGSASEQEGIDDAVEEVELLSRQHRILRQTDTPQAGLRELEEKLDEALRRLWSLRGAAAMGGPRADPPPVLGATDVRRQLLDDESTLLAYRLGTERSYLWLLTRSSFESFELAPGDEIAADVLRAHRLLRSSHLREARAATRQALMVLSGQLLGSAAPSLAGRRILIVADGALHYLPFSALPAPDSLAERAPSGDSLPLVAVREIVMLPSASSVAALSRRSEGKSWRGDVAVVAGGTPFSSHEGQSIRELGEESGRAVALASSPQAFVDPGGYEGSYRILHIAAHGEIDAARPELSRLIFDVAEIGKAPEARMLYADRIASLRLPAELVVLSACDTALGPVVPGEGFIGLPQAFFQAGASSVLVTLWKVDDQATAEVMERLYDDLLRAGEPPAAALQQAQNAIRTRPGRSAPYFWAGFVLMGDWRWN